MSNQTEDQAADLDDMARLLIERACERLVVEYCHRVDLHGGEGVLELFAPDASFEMLGERSVGREEIAKMYARIDGSTVTRHVCSTIAVNVVSAERATGVSYLTLYQGPSGGGGPARLRGPFAVAEYHDEFVLTGDGWRLGHRRVEVGFSPKSSTSP